MKAFLVALVALVIITVGANQILKHSSFSAQDASSSPGNVRVSN